MNNKKIKLCKLVGKGIHAMSASQLPVKLDYNNGPFLLWKELVDGEKEVVVVVNKTGQKYTLASYSKTVIKRLFRPLRLQQGT